MGGVVPGGHPCNSQLQEMRNEGLQIPHSAGMCPVVAPAQGTRALTTSPHWVLTVTYGPKVTGPCLQMSKWRLRQAWTFALSSPASRAKAGHLVVREVEEEIQAPNAP